MKNGDRVGDNTTAVKQQNDQLPTSGKVDGIGEDHEPDEILTEPRIFRNATSFVCVILVVSAIFPTSYFSLPMNSLSS